MQTPTARKRYERTLYISVLVLKEAKGRRNNWQKFSDAEERCKTWKKSHKEEVVRPSPSDPMIIPLSSIKYFHMTHQIQPVQKNDYIEMILLDQYQRILYTKFPRKQMFVSTKRKISHFLDMSHRKKESQFFQIRVVRKNKISAFWNLNFWRKKPWNFISYTRSLC